MAYKKTVWKDYPNETTPINAERLNNAENGIEANDLAIGNIGDIDEIGDGSLAGAIDSLNTDLSQLNNSLNKKQDAATAINTSNISSQSVNYATSAGSAVDQTARNNANAALAADITTGITFTNTTVFSAIGAQYVTKVGKMCTLHLCFGITSGINPSSLITQLPNGYRPATSIGNIGTIAFNNGTNYSATFNINQNGIISNVIAVPASTVLLDFSYFVN